MAFGFPAYHSEIFSPGGNGVDLRAAVKEALAALCWPVKQESPDAIVAIIGLSFWSWGEKVIIRFLPDHILALRSECIFPLQSIDWGKNKKNIRRFQSELQKHV